MYLSWEGIFFLVCSYLIGSLSTAIFICRLMKLPDPRRQGSKNPGATNVLRFGGKKAAIFTLLGDTLKGVLPVLLAKALGQSAHVLELVAIAAFLGHLYPIYFQFKGGKGVATAFGSVTALAWPVGLSMLLAWLTVAFTTRYSSLAALISALLAPVFTWFFAPYYLTAVYVMTLFLLWRHRQNIHNLLSGKEKKIGKK